MNVINLCVRNTHLQAKRGTVISSPQELFLLLHSVKQGSQSCLLLIVNTQLQAKWIELHELFQFPSMVYYLLSLCASHMPTCNNC